jgi:hypothetical protein
MQPTQTLPDIYEKAGTIDITKDQRLLIILNLGGLGMLCLSGWFFFQSIFWLRTKESLQGLNFFTVKSVWDAFVLIFGILILTAFYVSLHEAIHGLFFWIFTRSRPRFAFRLAYAYAAAPDWYLPRNAFLVTTLAPLVLISLAGLVVLAVIPPGGIPAAWYVSTMNASGAVGDLAVFAWLLRKTSQALICDRGDAVTLFLPKIS